ncbi:MAG: sugar ABC transporter permease [Caldilineaceae bacterium]|nr:sugar ABC transporter permease [Caldilineaceae bacterium]
MSSTVATKSVETATMPNRASVARLFAGRSGRKLRETLLAYTFLAPALVIIGLFGLFPLVFAAYESTLTGLNKIVGNYDGLGNYVKAIDNLTYVLGFGLSLICFYFAGQRVWVAFTKGRAKKQHAIFWLPAGLLTGASIAALIWFIFRLLPALLVIPQQLRGANNTTERFRELAWEAWGSEPVQQAFWLFVALLVAGLLINTMTERFQRRTSHQESFTDEFMAATFLALLGGAVGWLTWTEINARYLAAAEKGEGLDLWTQIITIGAGFVLLLLAWWLWESASERASNWDTAWRLGAAATLLIGGWLLIGELPRVVAAGDKDWWTGLLATVYYSLFTIPVQLIISLALATLLFQEIRGKGFFRIVYFIPYVAPFVGTAAAFRLIFSGSPNALLNRVWSSLGFEPLRWLNEPTGIFQLLLGKSFDLPGWAVGPSLALLVIVIYGTWTYIGFNTVVFMAGLGNIPREVYEAASIDGAGRWAQFRHVTLPLLSPTLYFLTLYSVIGTFKAFNHIYVLRTAAALGTTDTASIVIFQAFKRDTRYGYASALAILLLLIILILTAVNNRISSRRVFYG